MASEKGIRIRFKSPDDHILEQSVAEVVDAVNRTGARTGAVPPSPKVSRYRVLRSPRADKKSREKFEVRTHKRLLDILEPTQATVDALMRLDLPAGVIIEVRSFGNGTDDSVFSAIKEKAETMKQSTVLNSSNEEQSNTEPPDREERSAEVDLVERAFRILGSPQKLRDWMQTSIPALRGRTPYSLLQSEEGRKQVEVVLGRIEHGVY